MSLGSLLDDGARFDAESRGGLSNHLPLALTALLQQWSAANGGLMFADGFD